jgi:hypothetical protein
MLIYLGFGKAMPKILLVYCAYITFQFFNSVFWCLEPKLPWFSFGFLKHGTKIPN